MAQPHLSIAEYSDLEMYIRASSYRNMHTRKTRQKNKKKVLKHLNAVKRTPSTILGHVCGPEVEIVYEITASATGAQVNLHSSSIGIQAGYSYMEKVLREIMARVAQGHSTFRVRRTPGHFYLRRDNNTSLSGAAREAVAQNLLSDEFVTQAAKWKLKVIRGR